MSRLEPLSLNEARALVELLYDPGLSGKTLYSAGNPANPLHVMLAELPEPQRRAITTALDYTWPKPQRHRDFPVDISGGRMYGNKQGHDAWKEAWARAIQSGSMVQP